MNNPGTPELKHSRHQALVAALTKATTQVAEALLVAEVLSDPGREAALLEEPALLVAVAHAHLAQARGLAEMAFDEADSIFNRLAVETAGQSGAPEGPTTAGDENHG